MKGTATDLYCWCAGERREREMERFRGDMMVESNFAITHKTAAKTVQGVSGQGVEESNGVGVAKNSRDNEKKGE